VDRIGRGTPDTVIGEATISVLHPPLEAPTVSNGSDSDRIDDRSIVLKVAFGGRSVLIPGDIRKPAELFLLEAVGAEGLASDVLLAPHHGSRHSSSRPFVDAVDPELVVISAGARNRFGFPHPEIFGRFRIRPERFFRTDRDGAVEVRMGIGGMTVSGRASGRQKVLD
jgi:competence protein ComEC